MSALEIKLVRRFIAEHASRMIFAAAPDEEVTSLRPRVVDADQVKDEKEGWESWHLDQSLAERELMKPQ